jgi:low affinity Fe/Cu permease
MLNLIQNNINFIKRKIDNLICFVISMLMERKKNEIVIIEREQLEKVGDIYYEMEVVIKKELKYVGLKMWNF